MKKSRIISAILALVMACSVFTMAGVTTTADSGDWTPPLSITEPINQKVNKLPLSTFNNEKALANWNARGQSLEFIDDANGGYLKASSIQINWQGFHYSPVFEVDPGIYKFTGYFRTANKDEVSCVRVQFVQYDGVTAGVARVYITNEWQKVEFYVTLTDALSHILVNGGGYEFYVQDYCMDNFSLVAVDSIPGNAKTEFGVPNTDQEALASMKLNFNMKPYDQEENEQYEVKGIIINHDDSAPLVHIGRANSTYEEIAEFARQFEGTHITDYFICVNSNSASFPSESWTDYLDVYYKFGEKASSNELLRGAYHVYEELDTDYIGIWHEEFKKIGINPWLSFRMNDVHDMSSAINNGYESALLSDFFYDNPQYYRVQHHDYAGYMNYAPNYTYPEVRQHYLNLINDALNRYNTYGIELDFQREMRLWHLGGEYKGIEILNDFMRQVDDLVAVYEQKYGHEIKIAARVASDPITCEDFGVDPMTWAAEGILDMIIVGARWDNNDGDVPVRLWCSMMHPFGVEVAMNIELNNNKTWLGGASVAHDIETLAGLANQAFSQGADKVYFFNFFRAVSSKSLRELEEKIVTDETYYTVGSDIGYWNAITTLGSPEKVLTFDQRHIISYNDTYQVWKTVNQYVPASVSAAANSASYFRIPVGDVVEGAKLYAKFSTSVSTLSENPPLVFVNSEPCTFKEIGNCKGGYTSYKVMTYEIPESVYDDGYMLIEINSSVAFTTDYVEVYVEAPSW